MFIKEQKKNHILHWEQKQKLRIWRQEGKGKRQTFQLLVTSPAACPRAVGSGRGAGRPGTPCTGCTLWTGAQCSLLWAQPFRGLSYTSGVRNGAFPTPNPAAEVEELARNWEIAHGATARAPLATCLGYLASLPWQEGCQLQAAPRVPAHAAADRTALAEMPSPPRGDRLCSQPGGRRHPARCRSAGGTQPAANASHRLGARGGISFY